MVPPAVGAVLGTGAAFGTGAALGAVVPPVLPVPVGFADGPLPMEALPASATLSQIFPKMLTPRLAVLG
jgi:hypothetical protein